MSDESECLRDHTVGGNETVLLDGRIQLTITSFVDMMLVIVVQEIVSIQQHMRGSRETAAYLDCTADNAAGGQWR